MKKFILIILLISILAPNANAGDFKDSYVRINLFGGLSIVNGDILDLERDQYYITVIYDDGMAEIGKAKFSAYHYGIYSDVNIYNIKNISLLGLRAMYSYNKIKQTIKTGGGVYPEKTRSASFITYNAVTAGPVISILPGGIFGGGEPAWYDFAYVNLFFTAGLMLGGRIHPVPIARENEPDYAALPDSSGFSGTQMNLGGGIGLYIGLVNIGVDIYYSMNSIETDKMIYPEIEKKTTINETRFDMFLGVSI